MWPDLKVVHGKPRHPQSQGSVERANGDMKDMLVAWMADNISTDWTICVKFVQFTKYSSHHSGINRSPYAAMFGTSARVGLTSTSLPSEVISRLETEQDLLASLTLPSSPTEETPLVNEEEAAPSTEEIPPVTEETSPSIQGTILKKHHYPLRKHLQ